ncbi:fatty acid hydroxylase [Hysterangium stoloniferum]|nr:fatty acid hydroxylase [Hysterangium stoloniferum]
MDVVLDLLDEYVLDDVYAKLFPRSHLSSPTPSIINLTWQTLVSTLPRSITQIDSTTSFANTTLHVPPDSSAWPRDYIGRQILSLIVVTTIGIHLLYFLVAGLSYKFIFNHEMMRHPRFLPNQVKKEIVASLWSFPGMLALMLPFFLSEVRGYTKLYDNVDEYGWAYLFLSIPLFLLFTDYCVYWIHRWLHIPAIYKRIHKPHHKWIIPTPFASHAFHPVDGFAQSLPYHTFLFIFPMQHHLFLILFVFVNCWSIFIHDSDMITGHPLEKIINGPSHHTLHHLYFVCNYGQYFTFADRAGGSYRQPDSTLDPLLDIKNKSAEETEKERQEKERQGDDIAEDWEKKILGKGKVE